jgi:hypothetical protein
VRETVLHILSVGLWMADLAVTQLMQESVVETERGVVNGVQNSLNMLMDMLKFALVIALPQTEIFGIHILVSFSFIVIAGISFTYHCWRVKINLCPCCASTATPSNCQQTNDSKRTGCDDETKEDKQIES